MRRLAAAHAYPIGEYSKSNLAVTRAEKATKLIAA